MIKPKPFVMENPEQYAPGKWQFSLTAPDSLITFTKNLACVVNVVPIYGESHLVVINPRWDYQEAWMFIYEQLESESNETKLDDVWTIE